MASTTNIRTASLQRMLGRRFDGGSFDTAPFCMPLLVLATSVQDLAGGSVGHAVGRRNP
jgi:hypothetical protein